MGLLSLNLNPVFLITLIIAVLDASLGLLVYGKNRHRLVHGVFFIFTISVALWIAGVSMIFELPADSPFILQGFQIAFSGAAIMTALFFHFSVIFPFRLGFIRPRHVLTVYCVAAVFVYLSVWSSAIVENISVAAGVYKPQYGWGHKFFSFYFVSVMVSSIGLIFYKYRRAPENLKSQVKLFLIGAITALVGATVTNLFIPILTGSSIYSRYGPLALTPFIILSAYAIVRHKLLDVKVITTEMFSAALIFFLFTRLLFSKNSTDLMFNGGLFAAALFFILLLIHAVHKEIRDREEIAKLAAELARSNEGLKKLDQLKSEFISLASHQLRTPLTVIKGYISMVLEGSFGSVSDEFKKPLKEVMFSAEELIRLVNDLLDLGRIEAGRIQYQFSALSIDKLVERVVDVMRDEAHNKGVEMKVSNSLRGHNSVIGDPDKLSSAIMNIVDNAIKHSHACHVDIKLEERGQEGRSRESKNFILISFHDDGIGIAPDDLRRLFVKFSRPSKESVYNHVEGLGIGLYFTKRVIEDHHGKVWAESAGAGRGSTFYIELPAI